MSTGRWVKELPAEVMVCDRDGAILAMNDEAGALFKEDGGLGLLGSNVLNCHPEPSRLKLEGMLEKQTANAYFNTENGEKRFFFQSPWFKEDQYAGFVEISFGVPQDIPHFIREETMSKQNAWIKEFPAAATVCDTEGIILEMNDKAAKYMANDGGYALIGKNMFDCHPDPARGKLERLMDSRKVNVYTIEKNGVKKLIYQSPWYLNGEYAGFVELSFEIPFEMPHFVRS